MDYYFSNLINMAIVPRGGLFNISWEFHVVLVVNRDGEVVRELHSRIMS